MHLWDYIVLEELSYYFLNFILSAYTTPQAFP